MANIAVLMGGWSSERDVSLISGAGVVKALQELGHQVTAIDVQRDLNGLLRAIHASICDVIFNALHGCGGEDGTIQGVLDFIGLPYTHSGVTASAVAMEKEVTRALARVNKVPVAEGRLASKSEILAQNVFFPPFVIKPINEGSSIGVRVVRTEDDLRTMTEDSWIYGENVLIERYIPGRELTVSVLNRRALCVTELRPHEGFYDYTAKYTAGKTDHLVPAPIPEDIEKALLAYALLMHQVVGCKGVSRSDFRWDDTQPGTSGIYFLEINNQPGMTPFSLVPEQAAYCGLSYAQVCQILIDEALKDRLFSPSCAKENVA